MLDWCPFAIKKPSPNYSTAKQRVGHDAIVLHISEGSASSSLGWLTNPASEVSSHFFISKNGDLFQLVSLADVAWCNGLKPDGKGWKTPSGKPVTPRWTGLRQGVNPNRTTISIEHEGRTGEPMTEAMRATQTRLLKWLVEQLGWSRLEPGKNLIGHGDINPIDKSFCPGSAFDFSAIATAVAGDTTSKLARYRVINDIDYAQVRQDRSTKATEAHINGVSARLQPGVLVEVDDVTNGWAHLASGLGFVHMSLLQLEPTGLAFVSSPRISERKFVTELVEARSPAAASGPLMYRAIASVGICPGIGLAFFKHESNYGLLGLCASYDLKNMGNVRTAYRAERGQQLVIPSRGQFFRFASWELGALDWAERIRYRYIDSLGLDTVEKAVPVYAPTSDGNKPESYINAVLSAVRSWQKEDQNV